MEHLDLDGKRYVKVSSAARETGYTADYIGQLCRARKIDAKLVGRTWYVAADEINDHRRTRGRSSHEKVRQNVKEQLSDAQETNIPIRHPNSGLHRKRLLGAAVTYHNDDAELIPTIAVKVVSNDTEEVVSTNHDGQRTHHLDVLEKDTEKDVPVFTPAKKSEVKWNGTIVVEPLENEADTVESASQKSATAPIERHVKIYSEKERNNKPNLVISDVSSDPLEAKKRFLERMNLAHALNTQVPQDTETKTLNAARKERVSPRIQPQAEVAIDRPQPQSHAKHRFASLTLSATAAVGIFFLVATTFIESSSEYRAATGTQNSTFLSTFGVSSIESARELFTERVSGIRLLSQLSLF